MKAKPFVIAISVVGLVIVTAILFHFYQDRRARAQLMERKLPFAEAVALAVMEGNDALRKEGLIPASDIPPVACNLSCADVREFKIAKGGVVAIVLAGTRQADLEGKTIALSPSIANGNVTWTCRTNAPAALVPARSDNLPGILTVECSPLP